MMITAEKLKRCVGCRDDFYNGKNDLGVPECWLLDSARPVTRTRVGIWQDPPYTWRPEQTLSCHHPEGAVWIKPDDVRIIR